MANGLEPIMREENRIFTFVTRQGCEAGVYRGPGIAKHRLTDMDEFIRQRYPTARVRRPSDPDYNCHGLTFISRHGWVAAEDVLEFVIAAPDRVPPDRSRVCSALIAELLITSGFTQRVLLKDIRRDQLRPSDPVKSGDVAIYKRGELITHSGIVWERNEETNTVLLLSKWGLYGEYFHDFRNVPDAFGTMVAFWSDRS